jgi:hypothetical protein
LKKPRDIESAKKFVRVTAQLDVIRNENMFETIPEMSIVKEGLGDIDNG